MWCLLVVGFIGTFGDRYNLSSNAKLMSFDILATYFWVIDPQAVIRAMLAQWQPDGCGRIRPAPMVASWQLAFSAWSLLSRERTLAVVED